jgi:hypothetical protein
MGYLTDSCVSICKTSIYGSLIISSRLPTNTGANFLSSYLLLSLSENMTGKTNIRMSILVLCQRCIYFKQQIL